jgi:hypothetical protein
MPLSFRRPRNRTELEIQEARGLWKAIALARQIGESTERITLETILRIHGVMLSVSHPAACAPATRSRAGSRSGPSSPRGIVSTSFPV